MVRPHDRRVQRVDVGHDEHVDVRHPGDHSGDDRADRPRPETAVDEPASLARGTVVASEHDDPRQLTRSRRNPPDLE